MAFSVIDRVTVWPLCFSLASVSTCSQEMLCFSSSFCNRDCQSDTQNLFKIRLMRIFDK